MFKTLMVDITSTPFLTYYGGSLLGITTGSLLRVVADAAVSVLDTMGLNGALDEDQTALRTGNGAPDGDEVQICVHLDDVQILDGDLVNTHLACADLALEDTGGIGGGAHGTSVTMDRAAAVAGGSALCAPALDDALIAVALAGAGHVHKVALFEGVSLDDVANVQFGGVIQVELTQVLLGGHASLVQVAHFGLVSSAQECPHSPS